MGWKQITRKLSLAAAGAGCLGLLIYGLLPWLTQMQAAQERPEAEGIVADAAQGDDSAVQEGVGVRPGPFPVVARRDNGEEVAVVFPVASGGGRQVEAAEADEMPPAGHQEDIQGEPAEGLPPVLSPEEVAAAMAGPETHAEDADGPVAVAQALPDPVGAAGEQGAEGLRPDDTLTGTAAQPAAGTQVKSWPPEAGRITHAHGATHLEMTLPPPSATRDVQELLEALGYAPGPLDGIWGERTAAAWRRFARYAAELAYRKELARSEPEHVAEPSVPETPTASGEAVEAEGDGAGQAGESRHSTGLPPHPVVVPGTLRGVMGYRMPLVSRQLVPDQVVSGVLIPAHSTFVILKPGYWELVGLEPGEVERLRDGSARGEAAAAVNGRNVRPARRAWNPLRLFRRQGPSGSEK